MKNMNQTLAKAMSSMFTQVDNVSYDLASGLTGIKSDAGLLTLDKDGQLEQNPMDFFSMEIPAFAMLTPISEVKRGDLLVVNGKAYAFVLQNGMEHIEQVDSASESRERKQIEVITVNGHVSRFRPKKISMMGVSNGILVVKNFFSLVGNEQTGGMNMQSLLPMMMLSGDKKDMKDMLLPMMMMGGMGGQGMGGMNPLMLMMLMGDKDSLFK